MSDKSQHKRITDLFTEGEVLQPHPDSDALFFIKKLNSFEYDEARASAQVERSRLTLALRDEGSDEVRALQENIGRMDPSLMVDGIIGSSYTSHLGEASNKVYADPEWQERLDILDRTVRSEVTNPEERDLVDRINREYLDELNRRVEAQRNDLREELEGLDRQVLQSRYVDLFVETRASTVYLRELRFMEVFFGVRVCLGTQREDRTWDHKACEHPRVYDDVDEVRHLPDELLEEYRKVFDRLNVPARSAKGSASRQASSEPSRPPSEEEPFTPSTQAEVSTPPVSTSA